MICDSHLHTCFSGDSETPVKDQIEKAILLGMKELTITDHHDFDVDSGEIDFNLDLERYIPCMEQLKEEYSSKIKLNIGIELGLQRHLKEYFDRLLAAHSFDFVIGSTHFVNGLDPYYPQFFFGREEFHAYEEYFETCLNNVRELDCFDSAGHLDYIVRYGPNRNTFYNYSMYQDYIDEILKILISRKKALECNTAGFRQGLNQPNPHPDILKRYRELGGELITIGSDAHVPKDVGADFSKAGNLLKACGFSYYCTYQKRKPVFHPL